MVDILTVNIQGNFDLPIHSATLDYICDINPELEWKVRGINGINTKNKQEKEKLKSQRKEMEDFIQTSQGRQELNSFLKESRKVFLNLLSENKLWVKNYLDNQKFIFIIGAMRTAGTYLYTEMSKILDINWKSLNRKMSHDSIPTYGNLMRWNNPNTWLSLLFEFSQFLVWSKRKCINQKAIIQKRIAYGHALKFLDDLFGNKAEYIITVRHPGAIARYFKEVENINMRNNFEPPLWKDLAKKKEISRNQWRALDYNQRTLIYWEIYYEEIAKYGLPEGDIHILGYGKEEYEKFLRKFAQKNDREYQPDDFRITERNYGEFWFSDQVNEVIEQVNLWWKIHGFEFPELELK